MPRANDKIGPYTLIRKLGRGAFGVVWLAEKRGLITTQFALKLPNEEEVDLTAVEKEASVWLHAGGHPNVLPIIEADVYDDQVVIVSEYAPDGSLSKWLEKHSGNAPSIESAVEMMLGILAGLEHLHERGIIHRDLKPDNILLQRDTPRLADFGIARILKTTAKSTVATGTPAYMPPEAFDGKRSVQTDIWSVGVIFYQLLSGQLPFPQAEFTALVGAIITRDPEPLPDAISQPLQKVIGKALQKTPVERYKSASEMRHALRDAIQEQTPINYQEAKTEVLPRNADELSPTIIDNLEIPQDKSSSKHKLTELRQLQLEYWTAFSDFLLRNDSFLKLPKPQPQHWFPISIGNSNFGLVATVHRKGSRICAYFVFYGPDAKPHFHLLERDKEDVVREIGEALEWRELPKRKESQIRLCKYKTDLENRQGWETQHQWLKEKLELFHSVFATRIKNLNTSDYLPESEIQLQQINPTIEAATVVSPIAISVPSSESTPPIKPSQPFRAFEQPASSSKRLPIIIGGILAVLIISIVSIAIYNGYFSSPSTSTNKTANTSDLSTNNELDLNSIKPDPILMNLLPEHVQTSGELRIGTDATYPPFESTHDGKFIGFDIELGNAIAHKLGVKAKFINITFDGIFPALESGKFDAVMSIVTITPERSASFLFSKPYLESGQIIVVHKDTQEIESLDSLKNKRVGVQINTTAQYEVEKQPNVKVVKFNTIGLALLDLSNKQIDAVVSDEPIARYMIRKGFINLRIVGHLLTDEKFGIVLSRDNGALLQAINEALKQIKESGVYNKIYEKWFGVPPQ
jgi:ABC-type amino acid transport substrate-binding protein